MSKDRKLLPIGFRLSSPPAVRESLEQDLGIMRAMGFTDADLCLLYLPGDPQAGHGIINQIIPCPHEWHPDTRTDWQGYLCCSFCGNTRKP